MTILPPIKDLYYSDFKTKLRISRTMYREFGASLLSIPAIIQGLAVLEKKVQALQKQMAFLDLAPLCSSCAQKPGGGCCSLFMADENDSVLFLINLLSGHPVQIQKDDGFECYLLGAEGCILRYKPMFCLNYNCHAIKMHADAALLSAYLVVSSQLLQSQWAVEKVLLESLRGLHQGA